ncbi:unnamed protein product [Closterium sp. NIES-65]|nr:unnamed protein product [Closterium sp. NIES-65]
MADWSHIEYVTCAMHVLDLLTEDVSKITWCKDIVDRYGDMIIYVRNHHFTRNYLRSGAVKGGKGKQLVKSVGTRFGTNYIALSRLLQLRSTLSQMVLSEEYANCSAKGMMGTIYDLMLQLTEDVNTKLEAREKILPRAVAADIGKIARRRWDESLACALHAVEQIMNPANQEEGIFRNDVECTRIFKAFIARHYDGKTFTNKDGEEKRASLVLQEGLTAFLTLEGSFGLPEAIADREAVKAGKHSMVQWWGWDGTDHPHLASLACRALTQPVFDDGSNFHPSVFDDGSTFHPSVLDMSEDDLLGHFTSGVANVAAISLSADYPTLAAVPHVFANSYKNVISVALALDDYTFPLADKVKEILADPSKFMVAAVAAAPAAAAESAKEEAKPAEEEEEESDDDMGFSLFD